MKSVLFICAYPLEKGSSNNIVHNNMIQWLGEHYNLTIMAPKEVRIGAPLKSENTGINRRKSNIIREFACSHINKKWKKRLQKVERFIRNPQYAIKCLNQNMYVARYGYLCGKYCQYMRDMQAASIGTYYDIVISAAWPPSSHTFAMELLKKKRLSCKKYVQLWNEPWHHSDKLTFRQRREEYKMIKAASLVFYSDEMQLFSKQKQYRNYQEKIRMYDLPYPDYEIGNTVSCISFETLTIGYFGNYYSNVRNIVPLYESVLAQNFTKLIIAGASDIELASCSNIYVNGRVSHEKILEFMEKTDVLVVILNNIPILPGKLYELAKTNKIVIVLYEEMTVLVNYIIDHFGKYNRFIFAPNTKNGITKVLCDLKNNGCEPALFSPVEQLKTDYIMRQIMEQILVDN